MKIQDLKFCNPAASAKLQGAAGPQATADGNVAVGYGYGLADASSLALGTVSFAGADTRTRAVLGAQYATSSARARGDAFAQSQGITVSAGYYGAGNFTGLVGSATTLTVELWTGR